MAISEFEIFKVKKLAKDFCDERNKLCPPDKIRIDYRLEDQALFLLEIRPMWNDPSQYTENTFAKIWYIKKDKVWKLYWQRQNMSWLQYEPNGICKELEPLLKLVWDDDMGCFWG